jgi:hypothetical protein
MDVTYGRKKINMCILKRQHSCIYTMDSTTYFDRAISFFAKIVMAI